MTVHLIDGTYELFRQDSRDLALLFKDLATLRTDAPLFRDVDELRWRGRTSEFPFLQPATPQLRPETPACRRRTKKVPSPALKRFAIPVPVLLIVAPASSVLAKMSGRDVARLKCRRGRRATGRR